MTEQKRPQFLFVSDTPPEDVRECTHGVFRRMRLFLEALASMGDLHLLFYVTEKIAAVPGAAQRYVAEFDRYWNLTVSVDLCPRVPPVLQESILGWQLFHSPFGHGTGGEKQIAALAKLLARSPSVVVIHRLNAAYPLLRVSAPRVPVLFDLDDVEHVAFFRSVLQPPVWRSKLLEYLRIPAIIRLERRVARMASATFVCSDLDARYLSSVWRMPRVVAIPNAVTLPPQPHDALASNTFFLSADSRIHRTHEPRIILSLRYYRVSGHASPTFRS